MITLLCCIIFVLLVLMLIMAVNHSMQLKYIADRLEGDCDYCRHFMTRMKSIRRNGYLEPRCLQCLFGEDGHINWQLDTGGLLHTIKEWANGPENESEEQEGDSDTSARGGAASRVGKDNE